MTKLGLALGGGGIAGSAHIGVLYALEEAGFQIDFLAGSSFGAIIAALYGYGYTPTQLLEMVHMINKQYLDYDYRSLLLKFLRPKSSMRGFIKGAKIRHLIADITNNASMRDMKLPVAIAATDLKYARQVLFTSRPLTSPSEGVDVIQDIRIADAVQASISIPLLFKPVLYQDRILIDGGLTDNCPAAAVRALGAEKVIAVDLVIANPVNIPFDSLKSILTRVISINLAVKSEKNTLPADVVLRPDTGAVGLFDFAKISASVECGYEYTRKRIQEIKDVLAAEQQTGTRTPQFFTIDK